MLKKEAKKEFIKLRVTNQEHQAIKAKARAARMNKSKFILSAVSSNSVIVLDGLKDVGYQLRQIGNNLNQLTKLANQRQIICLELDETKKEIHQIWRSLNSLIEKTKNQSKV